MRQQPAPNPRSATWVPLIGVLLLTLGALGAQIWHARHVAAPAPANWIALLPGLLGLGAGLLGLRASQLSRPTLMAPSEPAPPRQAAPDLPALLDEWRQLLATEKQEFSQLHAQCGATGHEAMLLGARLAGVALDAEARLLASTTQAEQAWRNADGSLNRVAQATQRIERTLPNLAALIDRKSAEPNPSEAARLALADIADRVAAAGEAAARSIATMADAASTQLAPLQAAAEIISQQVASLDNAGARWLQSQDRATAQLNHITDQAQTALDALPGLVTTMQAAASAAVAQVNQTGAAQASSAELAATTLARASTLLETHATALAGTIDRAAQATEIQRESTENLRATERRLGSLAVLAGQAVTRGTELTESALRQLPNTASQLRDGLSALQADSLSMARVTQHLTDKSKAAAERLEHVTQQIATLLTDRPATLAAAAPDPAATEIQQEVARLSQALRDGRDAFDGAAQRLALACGALDGTILISRGAAEATIAVVERASQTWRDHQQTLERSALEAPNTDRRPASSDVELWRSGWESPTAFDAGDMVSHAADQIRLACEALNGAAHHTRITNEQAITQLDGLSRLTSQAEAITRLLPTVLTEVGQATATLHVMHMTLDGTSNATPVWRAAEPVPADAWLTRLELLEDRIFNFISQAETSRQPTGSAGAPIPTAAPEPWRHQIATIMDALPNWLAQLSQIAQRMEHASGALTPPTQPARADIDEVTRVVARLADSSAQIGGASQQLQHAIARQDAAALALEAAMMRVETASQTVQQITAADLSLPADLATTLRQLTAVQGEAHSLLRQSESVAEAVLTGQAPDLRPVLAGRIPALLSQLDVTIQHLRATATALALASDGPDARRAA